MSLSAQKISKTTAFSNNVRPFGMRDKIGYMFGDFGNDFFFILVANFLMVYYTDVLGISAGLVGLIFLVARVWDAFVDISWGRFVDTRQPTSKGKYRPWFYRMSFPMVIMGLLMFVQIPGMSNGFYLAYAFITYLIWGSLFSTTNMPYGSMASVISNDPVDRTSLSTFRSVGAQLASLIVSTVGPMFLFVNNKASGSHFFILAIIFVVLSIICFTISYKLLIERVVMPVDQQEKLNIRNTLKGIAKNKPLLVLLCIALVFLLSNFLLNAVNVYLFKNYFGFAKALTIVGIIQSVGTIAIAPAIRPLVAKFGKKEIASVGMLIATAVYALLYFLPVSAYVYIGISTIGMLAVAIFNLTIWAFVTDAISYHEYLTGLREDATVYSIYSFSRKIGQAAAGGLGGAVIAAVGYNAKLPVQTQSTLNGIHALGTLGPALFYGVVFLLLLIYPLNKKRSLQLAHDLAEKSKPIYKKSIK
ncbi:MFS transporter [Priestia megaterium]|uniref:MFS transporter n=1 Tax=Priestia megaterium TaxID=1404 RepID=A0A6H1P108_PRIMG|nr:glycoside-pentoside-hexuronide (GPH):cation symporter [Priestia megaterium]QIZ07198.1 MFS transporter [Priestia megaterium]